MNRANWDFPGEDYPPPQSVLIADKEVTAGDRVRLHPKVRADAFDMLLDGRTGRVEAIQQDFENRLYLVIALDDDPGREQQDERVLPGHRFYFFPEEVEPLPALQRILIACIGNIFLGDDGFGVEVAQRLKGRQYAEGVQVIDFGIRGIELAYTLLDDGYDTLILVDAVPRGGSPGTLYLIEPDLTGVTSELGVEAARAGLAAHSLDPVKVLAFATALGSRSMRTLLVGCEPTPLGADENYTPMQMGLSEPVQEAVDEAVKMIDSLIQQLVTKEI